MSEMLCFQCEQTVPSQGCTTSGVCGKGPSTSALQDQLTFALIRFAMVMENQEISDFEAKLMMEGLFTTVTNVSFDDESLQKLINLVEFSIENRSPLNESCGSCTSCLVQPDISSADELFKGDADQVAMRSLLLLGLRGMGAYAYHAYVLGYSDPEINEALFINMRAVGLDHSLESWLSILMQFGQDNYRCMELLDKANTGSYGHPQPTEVTTIIEPGPFIVVTGHDYHDLKELLDQSKGKGVNIYTHGEMLPAHAYPGLKKYEHLKGNFGTAWQNQQKEFDGVPGAFLFTTNCLMPPRDSYKDRVFTTALVQYPGLVHISDSQDGKDFTPVIQKALDLGGYQEEQAMTGINGGRVLKTGFAHKSVLDLADQVVGAVKEGAVKHILLVGGCDGAKPGRNYYTDIVSQSPEDTLILTLACGKFRFNDLDLGKIGPFPRIMDMGQCNDSYSAIKVALALAEAFETDINSLPLTLVLSWYEQKAVCVLLTLLSLGVKNIFLGPTLPYFVTENVLNVLVDQFALRPISTVEEDLKAIFSL